MNSQDMREFEVVNQAKSVDRNQINASHSEFNITENSMAPPDLQLAQNHRLANLVGKPLENSTLCKCCGYAMEREQFPLCKDTESMGFLGSGYPLYFDFIKSCIILIGIQWITCGQFLFIANIKQIVYLIEPTPQVKQIGDVLSFTSTFFMIAYLLFFRHNQKKLDRFCDLQMNTPGDYTVLVQGFETNISREELELKIMEHIENVVKVTFIYKQFETNKQNSQKQFREQLEDTYFENNYFSGSALVSFKLKAQKNEFLEKAQNNKQNANLNYCLKTFLHVDVNQDGIIPFEDMKLRVRQAPEPSDIHWQQINQWVEQSYISKLMERAIKLFLLISYLLITCLAEYDKNRIFSYKGMFIPFLICFNYFGLPIIIKRSQFRKYLSWTGQSATLSFKLAIVSALLTIFIISYFEGEVIWIFISNALLPPIFILIRPNDLKKQYILNHSTHLNQQQTNILYEYSNHYLARNQAHVAYTMIIAYFYGGLLPVALILSEIGLILYFWIEKYSILRQSTIKHKPSSSISMDLFQIVQFIPLVQTCQHFMQSQQDIIATIQLICVLSFILIPIDIMVDFIWIQPESVEQTEYNESNFHESYDRLNPALQDKAIHQWVTQKNKPHNKQIKKRPQVYQEPKLKEKQKQALVKQLTKVQRQMRQIELQWEERQGQKLITVGSDNISKSV